MKKIFILAVIAFSTIYNAAALDLNDYTVFSKLNNEKTLNSLSKYLNADQEQKERLEYVFTLTDKKIKNALTKEDEQAAEQAMWFNLANAKSILSEEQYKKYLVSLNMTLNSMNDNSEFFAEK